MQRMMMRPVPPDNLNSWAASSFPFLSCGRTTLPAIFAAPSLAVLFIVLTLLASATQGDPLLSILTPNARDRLELHSEKPGLAFNTNFPPEDFSSADRAFMGVGTAFIAMAKPRIDISFVNHNAVEYSWRSAMG